jgi:hypothetical protein
MIITSCYQLINIFSLAANFVLLAVRRLLTKLGLVLPQTFDPAMSGPAEMERFNPMLTGVEWVRRTPLRLRLHLGWGS